MSIGSAIKVFLSTSKGKVIATSGGTAVAVGIGVAVLLQGGGYRSISVEQIGGTVNVIGEKNNGSAYVGENLYSGDDITVLDASELTMCMDGDKFVYADANTHFSLEASDKSEDSRIRINLDAGSELNVLENKLGENESYQVDTPNSTMSVRGTKFRVTVFKGSDGLIYTLMEVEDGLVLVQLKTTDGSYNGIEQLFSPGQSAFIRGNSDFSEFVMTGMLDSNDIENGDDDSNKLKLAYDNLPEDGMERLLALLDRLNQPEPEPEEEEEEVVEEEPEEESEEEEEEELEEEPEAETPTLTVALADKESVFKKMYDEAVTGIDGETGYFVLTDGTLFDPVYYAEHNPDVVEKFGSKDEELLAHYLIYGKDEKRAPSEKVAKAKEDEWLSFAKMLDEDMAAKMAASEAAEAAKYAKPEPVKSSSGGGEDTTSTSSSLKTASNSGGVISQTPGIVIDGIVSTGLYSYDLLSGNTVVAEYDGTSYIPKAPGVYYLPIPESQFNPSLSIGTDFEFSYIDFGSVGVDGITIVDNTVATRPALMALKNGPTYNTTIDAQNVTVFNDNSSGSTKRNGTAKNITGLFDVISETASGFNDQPGELTFGNGKLTVTRQNYQNDMVYSYNGTNYHIDNYDTTYHTITSNNATYTINSDGSVS